MTSQSVAVVGLGGIGGVVAGVLGMARTHSVVACVRRAVSEITLHHPGGEARVALRALTDPAEGRPVDWILLCTKAQDTAAAGRWLTALCGTATRVAVLQNGLGHAERVAPHIGGAPVVPAVIYLNGERVAPAAFRFRRVTDHDMAVPDDADGRAFAALFRDSLIDVCPSDDFAIRVWRKLLINIVANPLTAITRQRQHVLRRDDIRLLGLAMLEEAVAVGRAEGVQLPLDEARAIWELLMTYPAEAGTSMYHDTMAGRQLEVAALTGAVVQAGERHGIPMPLNRMMQTLLAAVSDAAGQSATGSI